MADLAKQQAEVLSDAFQEAGYITETKPEYGVGYRLLIGREGKHERGAQRWDAGLLVDDESNISKGFEVPGTIDVVKMLTKMGLAKYLVDNRAPAFKELEIR